MVMIRRISARIIISCLLTAVTSCLTYSSSSARAEAATLRDLFWVWNTPRHTNPGEHTLTTFVQAPAAEKAKLLSVPNVVMAGAGIPHDETQAEAWTRAAKKCPHIVWEICPDSAKKGETKPPFVYQRRIELVGKLVRRHPAIEGVLLDDMSSVGISHGFKPEHVRRIRELLNEKCPQVRIWGVLYTMNLDRPGVEAIVRETDVINLWVWHARDLVNLEQYVTQCEQTFPGKPIVLGLYLRDYGEGEPMTVEKMKLQCETARKLAHQGRIKGIVFLTIDNDEEILSWTADWIRRVGDEPLGSAASARRQFLPVRTVAQETEKPAESVPRTLHIGDGGNWHFVGGSRAWTESGGLIKPPNQRNLHSRAFYTEAKFSDLEAEFEFNPSYRETGTGAAGMILRAADVNHCYILYFPWGGQQLRAKHFWAQLMKVDGDGYLRSLKSVWVPGLPSETDRWYKVRMRAKGPSITAWVDGRKALNVKDESFSSGVVGLTGYGWYAFRNVRIKGHSTPLSHWDRRQTIPVHHFTLDLDSQVMPSGCVAPNGDVLLMAGKKLLRSKNKGRTWQKPEPLPKAISTDQMYGNALLRTSDDRLIVQLWRNREQTRKEVPEISIAESTDNGRTWSKPVQAKVAEGWPKLPARLTPYGSLVETRDGTLLRFLLGSTGLETGFPNLLTWGSFHCRAFVTRSTDGGKSWSAPIEIDRPSWCNQARGSMPGSLDFTEPTGVAIGNKVTALVRPVYSPYMWQCWSYDAGRTWDSAARATFPGYAQSMIRCKSGAIVCAHRFPQYSVNVSRDNGLNWDEGTIIDYPVWAMGCMVEVEPDVLLCTYMNWKMDAPLLAQLIRITDKGIEPIDNQVGP